MDGIERSRPGSLVRRVALGAGASAAFGAIAAAGICIVTIDQVLTSQLDQRLRAACAILAEELDEEAEEGDSSLHEVLDDENGELVQSGIRLAVYQGKRLVAGDGWVPRAGGVRCVSRGELGRRVRACGRDYHDYRLVAAQRMDDRALSLAYLSAALAALIGAAVVGALGSVAIVRFTLRPLSRLVARVRALSGSDPDPAALAEAVPVTELEALRSSLYESLARTRDHLTHVQRFSADAAHELLTPLSILQAELDLLAEDTNGEVRLRVERLGVRIRAVTELVRRLLVLATPASIDRDLPLLALASVVDDVVSALDDEARSRVHFEEESEGLLHGDEALLRSLVHNALDNALKYSEGEVRLRVFDLPAANDVPARVGLDVRDFGPGIAPELRARVFEPFVRARSAQPGYGLGLALIQRIAVAHGGSAELWPADPGLGLSVRFTRAPGASPSP